MDTLPERIGEFTVGPRLGAGGEAEVYRASATRTGPVALKVRRSGSFAAEFALASRVAARHTARPIATGTAETGPYLAMELLDDYAPVARAYCPGDVWRVAFGLADALAAVHAAGVVHCDVKPGNVLVGRAGLRVVDFGIARDLDRQPAPGRIVHYSRGWAAPEQIEPAPLTAAADVFGWGCLVAYAATGESPYRSATVQEWLVRVRLTRPDLGGLPEHLTPLVRAALDRDPAVRPSAADLAVECRRRSGRTLPPGHPAGRPRIDEPTLAAAA